MEKVINFSAFKANRAEAKAKRAQRKAEKKAKREAAKADPKNKRQVGKVMLTCTTAFLAGVGAGVGIGKAYFGKDEPVIDDAPSELPFEQEIEVPETEETVEPMDM